MSTPTLPDSSSLPPLAVREREAARLLGISPKSVFNLTKAGLLPCVRLGGMKLYSVAALHRWLDEQAPPTGEQGGGR